MHNKPPCNWLCLLCALLISGCSQFTTAPSLNSSSILIKNAIIVDGTGGLRSTGAVRIKDQYIVAIGALEALEGEQIIDAGGLVIAPGFIDTHSHHDVGLADNRDALPLLTQGITTSVFGQDGGHSLPLQNLFDDFDANPSAVNFASYVGHNTLREEVMGQNANQQASSAQIAAMQALLKSEMDSGALGLSTGLEYEPGLYSTREEVLTLAKDTAKIGGRYISHMRSEDRFVWDAVDEVINIGRETGMPVQVSHIKLAAKGLWGQSERMLGLLNGARAEGIDITADLYPYEYWQSTIWVLLPNRDADDLEEIKYVLDELTPADGIIFTHFEPDPSYVNKSVAEIALLRGTTEVQTLSNLMKEAQIWSAANDDRSAESIMGRSMSERDIETFAQWPHINISSDGGFQGHPRGYGTFPRIFANYVRGSSVLSVEKAVESMTSRAALHMGFTDRGIIQPGFKADLVLFDPETMQDHASIRDGQVLSSGVEKVWVNGVLVLDKGEPTGARSGQVLRR